MLFLLNDAVLDVDLRALMSVGERAALGALSLADVLRLGAEMFAEAPLLHQTQPDRARRLAALIVAKAPPGVNAAVFEPASPRCRADEVSVRLAEASVEVMASRYGERGGTTSPPARAAWRSFGAFSAGSADAAPVYN